MCNIDVDNPSDLGDIFMSITNNGNYGIIGSVWVEVMRDVVLYPKKTNRGGDDTRLSLRTKSIAFLLIAGK